MFGKGRRVGGMFVGSLFLVGGGGWVGGWVGGGLDDVH